MTRSHNPLEARRTTGAALGVASILSFTAFMALYLAGEHSTSKDGGLLLVSISSLGIPVGSVLAAIGIEKNIRSVPSWIGLILNASVVITFIMHLALTK